MADGGKLKIRHKNMTDGVAENGGRHDGQKNYIYININNTIDKK